MYFQTWTNAWAIHARMGERVGILQEVIAAAVLMGGKEIIVRQVEFDPNFILNIY